MTHKLLRFALANPHQGIGRLHDNVVDLLADRDQLAAEVEALRVDAERYRWLRNPTLEVAIYIGGELPFSVDAVIDSARKE